MKNDINWKRQTVESVFTYLVAQIFAAMFALFSSHFRDRILSYNKPLLLMYGLTLLAVASWDVRIFRRSKKVYVPAIPYVVSGLVFICFTSWSSEQTIQSNVPIWISLVIFGFGKFSHLVAMQQLTIEDAYSDRRVGFAATGVVICNSNLEEPVFILVFNRNLRAGAGLWVPPGGHFVPYLDDPLQKLLTKVREEIGMDCTPVEGLGGTPQRLGELRSDKVRWLLPPAFLLEEDMMGRCSHGHEIHLDFIYLLLTDGATLGKNHKYAGEQVRIPVRNCFESIKSAESAISAAIEGWHLENNGSRPGVRDNLTSDVTWRLHLAAQLYLKTSGVNKS